MAESFLKTFVQYLRTRTDAPPDWSLHAGMATLSIAAGNDICTDGRSRDIYPNLWITNIGRSGSGKSVALDFSALVIHRAGLERHILADSFSGEALYDEFGREATRIAYFQEFGAFMDQLGREYMGGTMKWLTALYDVPEVDKRVLRNQTVELRLPFLTILGASTPEWFAESFKSNMLRGGFLARFIFCPSDQRGSYVEEPGPHDAGLIAALADHIRTASNLVGRVDFGRVLKKFNEWDRETREKLLRGEVEPEFEGMVSRASVLAKKAAMLYHLSADPESLTVLVRDLDNAIAYVERNIRTAIAYLSENVAHNAEDAECLRVIEIVARLGGVEVPRQVVLKNSHMSAQRLDRAERTLVESGRIVVRKDAGKLYSLASAPIPLNGHTNGYQTSQELRKNFAELRQTSHGGFG